ncbi:MAG TPA: hypothetical protein VMM15_40510, partial [Bradyrhizobium sp.]|nr:hypothetical protein [Bradyrhizobium sp.]
RIRGLIAQPRFSALRMVDEVALLAALAEGVFDPVPVAVIKSVRSRIAAHLDSHLGDTVAAVTKTGKVDDAALAALVAAVRSLAQAVRGADLGHEASTP